MWQRTGTGSVMLLTQSVQFRREPQNTTRTVTTPLRATWATRVSRFSHCALSLSFGRRRVYGSCITFPCLASTSCCCYPPERSGRPPPPPPAAEAPLPPPGERLPPGAAVGWTPEGRPSAAKGGTGRPRAAAPPPAGAAARWQWYMIQRPLGGPSGTTGLHSAQFQPFLPGSHASVPTINVIPTFAQLTPTLALAH
eukprot:1177705-Prorocentrum_minimum.AAC.2